MLPLIATQLGQVNRSPLGICGHADTRLGRDKVIALACSRTGTRLPWMETDDLRPIGTDDDKDALHPGESAGVDNILCTFKGRRR